MPPDMQAKLLRVLQEQEFAKVGGITTIRVDARVIAASNKDLQALCRQGIFRYDLFYRLNVMTIHIPPLRDRLEDLELLVATLLKKLAGKLDRSETRISAEAMASLGGYHWPGNVRELENVLERA